MNMIKVVISSKHLATELNKLDLDNYNIFQIKDSKDRLFILSGDMSIELGCHIDFVDIVGSAIDQEDVNWLAIRKLANNIEEQPIILQIYKNSINIILSF